MIAGLVIAAVPAAVLAGGAQLELVETLVHVEGTGLLALRDLDGDGVSELLFIDRGGIGVRYLREEGRYPPQHDAFLPWPGDELAWDLTDIDGDGAVDVVMLIEGREIRAWKPDAEGGFAEGELLLEVRSYLPEGISRMSFARDVDGDGLPDLVVPGSGSYAIHLQRKDGSWSAPILVSFEADINYDVGDPTRLSSQFGQRVRIPWFRLEDIDGDGRPDLVSEFEDRVLFHLASPEISDEPTWSLDRAALREELPDQRGVNFEDLLTHVARRVTWSVDDLDGEYPRDLILQIGSSLKIYLGGALTGPEGAPDQLLKSSGNVLYFFVRDVEGDEHPELQLVRSEGLSLGRILRWLILPGKLDFDVFTYRNDAGTFSRKPTKRTRLSLKIPRLLTFIDEAEGLADDIESQFEIPAKRADLRGRGQRADIVDVVGGELQVFLGRAPVEAGETFELAEASFDSLIESLILRDLDRLEDGRTKTVDLGDVQEWQIASGVGLRAACEGASPSLCYPLAGGPTKADSDPAEWAGGGTGGIQEPPSPRLHRARRLRPRGGGVHRAPRARLLSRVVLEGVTILLDVGDRADVAGTDDVETGDIRENAPQLDELLLVTARDEEPLHANSRSHSIPSARRIFFCFSTRSAMPARASSSIWSK